MTLGELYTYVSNELRVRGYSDEDRIYKKSEIITQALSGDVSISLKHGFTLHIRKKTQMVSNVDGDLYDAYIEGGVKSGLMNLSDQLPVTASGTFSADSGRGDVTGWSILGGKPIKEPNKLLLLI